MSFVKTTAVHFLDAGFIREKIQKLRVAEFQQMRFELAGLPALSRVNKFVFLVARLLERPGLFSVAPAAPHPHQRGVERQRMPRAARVDGSGNAAGGAAEKIREERS